MSAYDPPEPPSPQAQRRIAIVATTVVLVGAAIGIWNLVYQYYPFWHWHEVEPGRFYRSSQLGERELGQAIRRYRIKTIFNLRDESERQFGTWYSMEHRVAAENGARVVDIPLKAGTPPSPEQIQEILRILDDPANLPAMAHCYHGSIRSAAAEGLWRREYMSEDGQKAYDRVERWGRDLEEDYPEIADFIKHYVPRRDRKPGADKPGADKPGDRKAKGAE